MCTKFQLCTPHSLLEKCDENVFNDWDRRERKVDKGKNKQQQLAWFQCTIHPPIGHMCTKIQLCRPYSSWENRRKFSSESIIEGQWQNHGRTRHSIAPLFQSGAIKYFTKISVTIYIYTCFRISYYDNIIISACHLSYISQSLYWVIGKILRKCYTVYQH